VLAWPAASTLAVRVRGPDGPAFGRTADDFYRPAERSRCLFPAMCVLFRLHALKRIVKVLCTGRDLIPLNPIA
jgi:hypothetical protein